MSRQPSIRPLRDKRYSVTTEHCGYPTRRFVARFCDLWIGQAATRPGAIAIVRTHAALERARQALAQADADFDLAIAVGRAG